MPHHTLLSELIGDIYEASYQPHYWPVVIEKICRLTESRSGALFIQDSAVKEANGFYPFGFTHQYIERYSCYSHLDPAFSIMRDVPEGVAVNIQTTARHALESPEYYEQMRVGLDVGHIAGSNVVANESQIVGLGLHRSFSSPTYDEAALRLIADLIPHLQRALRIHREFIRLRVEKSALSAGLENMMMGLILLDHLGQPVYLNPVAREILENHPAIALVNDAILPSRNEDAARLRKLIVDCIQPGVPGEENRGGVLGLHHEQRHHPLAIMVKPVATSEIANIVDGIPVYAALYLSDPDRHLPISADNLAALYDLSRTEAQIAIALANGKSIEEIAHTHGRSINTLRSQLKTIFKKTNTNGQSGLLRLLLAGVPA